MASMLEYAKYGKRAHVKEARDASACKNESESLSKNAGALDALSRGAAFLTGGLLAGSMLKATYDSIRRDNKAKQVFESLSNDPQLSRIDKGTLAEWFAAIYHYSPTAASDKATAKELMHQFAMFGKVDLQTLKTLAEIEEKRSSSEKDKYDVRGAGAHIQFASKALDVSNALLGTKAGKR